MQFFGWQLFKKTLAQAALGAVFVFIAAPITAYAFEFHDDLFSVSFVDDTNGWACGRWGSILHSADGGMSWIRQESGTDFTLASISFADTKNGWAVGGGGTIIYTSDGGKTWIKQDSPVSYFLMGVCFMDPKRGWVVTERTNILYTDDGGKTWQVQFSDEDYILKSVSFCDEYNGWAVGEYGYIYHTKDGGNTWEHQAGEFGLSEETGDVIGGYYLFDVVAIDPDTAWVSGIDGYVAKTTDGGVTWEQVKVGLPKTPLFDVALSNAGPLVIGGDGTLLCSFNGGHNFHASRTEPSIKYGWIYGIGPKGGSGFVAVGSGGWIYITDSKVKSWQKVSGK